MRSNKKAVSPTAGNRPLQKAAWEWLWKSALFMGLVFISGVVSAQQSCTDKLKTAEELYEMGQIDKVEPLLDDCLRNGFDKEQKVKAYRLLALCYLYYNEEEKATTMMAELLKVDPEYRINRSKDPSEFIYLHNKFRTRPVCIIGFKAGGGLLGFADMKNFNDINSAHANGSYQPNASLIGGVSVEVPVYKSLAVSTEVLYNLYSYTYSREQVLNYTDIEMTEDISSLNVPLLLQWNFEGKDFTPYINAGMNFSLLLKSSATFNRLDSDGTFSQEPISGTIDLSESRNAMNMGLCGSIGFRWKNILGKGYLSAEVRHVRNLKSHVEAADRAQDLEMVYSYLTTDNTMKMYQTYFFVSYKIPIYLAKQKRKKRK